MDMLGRVVEAFLAIWAALWAGWDTLNGATEPYAPMIFVTSVIFFVPVWLRHFELTEPRPLGLRGGRFSRRAFYMFGCVLLFVSLLLMVTGQPVFAFAPWLIAFHTLRSTGRQVQAVRQINARERARRAVREGSVVLLSTGAASIDTTRTTPPLVSLLGIIGFGLQVLAVVSNLVTLITGWDDPKIAAIRNELRHLSEFIRL